MEFEFDKEIDAILQKARESKTVFADNPKSQILKSESLHLDADEISAFAENALPEKTKRLYMAHLADCDRCRRILSNLMIFNSEAGFVPASLIADETIVEIPVPWYRKIFAMPNLAFAMGACVLVFGGILGVLVMQNLNDSNVSVSQIGETEMKERGPYIDQDAPIPAANMSGNMSNATMATTNSAVESSSNLAAISTNSTAANTTVAPGSTITGAANRAASSNSAAATREEKFDDQPMLKQSSPITSATPPPTAAKPAPEMSENEAVTDAAEDKSSAGVPPPAPPPAPPAASMQAEKRKSSPKKAERDDAQLSDARVANAPNAAQRAGGKTFRRVGSEWIDNDYRQGANTTKISRGSNEYKKLDSGLRGIAEQFDGVVIVVWKSKGYRIQ